MKQKAKEAQVMAAEAEFNRLNRRVQELEEDLENRAADDEAKLIRLADELKSAQKQAEDADKMYDETQKKMMETERNLEVSDERASVGEFKIIELEEELKVVANNLRSLEVSEDKANKRESHYKEENKRSSRRLRRSWTRPLPRCLDTRLPIMLPVHKDCCISDCSISIVFQFAHLSIPACVPASYQGSLCANRTEITWKIKRWTLKKKKKIKKTGLFFSFFSFLFLWKKRSLIRLLEHRLAM